MKLKRKTRNILSIILVTLLTFGLGFGIYSIASTKTKTISPTIFSVGGIGNDGKHIKNKLTLYNEDYIECQGLRIERDFESTVKYDIHYYDVAENYLGSVSCTDDNYSLSNNFSNARYCRVVIKPQNRTKDISIFETYSIAKQLKITVDKDQDYVSKYNVFDYETENSGFNVSSGKLVKNSNNDYNSYYVKVAKEKNYIADRLVILSSYDLKSKEITTVYNTSNFIPNEGFSAKEIKLGESFVTADGYYAYVIDLKTIASSDCYIVFNHLSSQTVPQIYLYTIPETQQSA